MKLIGEIMDTLGYVSVDCIVEARRRQMRCPDKKIGECLIELGHATLDRIDRALIIQQATNIKHH